MFLSRKLTTFCLVVFTISLTLAFACGGRSEEARDGEADRGGMAGEGTVAVAEPDLDAEVPLLKVGHCNHDHHSAVFVSALRGDEMKDLYEIYAVPLGEKYYAVIEDGKKVLEVEFVQSQGAINVPNNMVAGLFDIGFGGVIPFAASADQGSGVKIISPLHSRGDMLVLADDIEGVDDWDSFVEWVKSCEEPVTIGFKSPKAVALLIFESALNEAGITWSMQGNPEPGSDILLFNAQGQSNLNPALRNGTIRGYVSNNPACALAEYNGIGKCIAELSDLPPGDFANHPCCAIAATDSVIAGKPEEIATALRLFAAATDYINKYPEDAAEAVAEWIGNPVEVELASMATSGYDMKVTGDWLSNMVAILDNMRKLKAFSGPLAEKDDEADAVFLYDFSLLPEELR